MIKTNVFCFGVLTDQVAKNSLNSIGWDLSPSHSRFDLVQPPTYGHGGGFTVGCTTPSPVRPTSYFGVSL